MSNLASTQSHRSHLRLAVTAAFSPEQMNFLLAYNKDQSAGQTLQPPVKPCTFYFIVGSAIQNDVLDPPCNLMEEQKRSI